MNEGIVRKEITPFDALDEERQDFIPQEKVDDPTKLNLDKQDPQQKINDGKETAEEGRGETKETFEETGEGEGDDSRAGNTTVEEGSEEGTSEEAAKEDSEEGVEPQFEVEDNAVTRYFAETLVQRGKLPEDFEITDETTEADIDEAYLAYNTEPLTNTIRQEELRRLREEEGITEEMIQEMKYRHYGVQDEELALLQNMSYLHNYKFDDRSETYEEEARAFLNDFYTLNFKGYSPERINTLVNNDINDDNLAGIISEYQSQLGVSASSLKEAIDAKAAKAEQDRKDSVRKTREERQQLLEKGEINGKKYTSQQMEKVKNALFVKSEIIVGADGKRYKVTPYYKMVLESRQDLEKDLENKIRIILGDTNAITKAAKEGEERGQKKVVSRLNKYISKTSKKDSGSKQTPPSQKSGKQESHIERRAIN